MSLRSTEEGGGFVWTKCVLLELATGLWPQGSLVKCRRISVTFNGSLNDSTFIFIHVKDLASCLSVPPESTATFKFTSLNSPVNPTLPERRHNRQHSFEGPNGRRYMYPRSKVGQQAGALSEGTRVFSSATFPEMLGAPPAPQESTLTSARPLATEEARRAPASLRPRHRGEREEWRSMGSCDPASLRQSNPSGPAG